MIIHYCDKCKQKIISLDKSYIFKIKKRSNESEQEIELCDLCAGEIIYKIDRDT